MDLNHDGTVPDQSEDDELGSWEEMEDSGALDERLEKQLKSHQTGNRDRQTAKSPIMLQEDSTRTAYQPQLKILKRQPGADTNGDVDDKESKQTSAKTTSLAEREAAYAEARKRIMGSAASSEEPKQGVTHAKPSTSNTRLGQSETTPSTKGKR